MVTTYNTVPASRTGSRVELQSTVHSHGFMKTDYRSLTWIYKKQTEPGSVGFDPQLVHVSTPVTVISGSTETGTE